MRILAFSLSFLLLSAPLAANAVEPINFNGKIPESSSLTLNAFFQQNAMQPLSGQQVAPVDLNGDGLNEFITREQPCSAPEQDCAFKILSETDDRIIPLGEIKARSILLGNKFSQGVRDILAIKNGANDYEYTVYVWEPALSKYIMAGQTP